jgi:ankyrin repeat protein
MQAARGGDVEMMQILFEIPRVDVNQIGPEGYSMLMIAASRGHLEMVLFLLGIPEIRVDATGFEERSALMCACMNGNSDIVRALLAHRTVQDSERHSSRLFWLFTRRLRDLFAIGTRVCPDSCSTVNERDSSGWTALMHATRYRRETLAIMLIKERNADPTASDFTNVSVFMMACMYSLPILVAYLLTNNLANLEQQTSSGWTALMFAGVYATPEIVVGVVKAGASIGATEYHGRSVIQLCLQNQKYSMARILNDSEEERIYKVSFAFALCLGNKQDRTAPCSKLKPDLVAIIISLCAAMQEHAHFDLMFN